jgi:hypothetical protein
MVHRMPGQRDERAAQSTAGVRLSADRGDTSELGPVARESRTAPEDGAWERPAPEVWGPADRGMSSVRVVLRKWE